MHLRDEARKFYQSFFRKQVWIDMNAMLVSHFPKLSYMACAALTTLITKEEVKVAVMCMESLKALGPDGFQPFLF